jgi:superfamily II RNA helicase
MAWPLFELVKSINPKSGLQSGDLILEKFLKYISDKGLKLYPAQEEAILEIFSGKNVILNTPTGSGKSLVALAAHFYSIVQNRKSFYTSPIKALVNEKFFALCREFGPEQVGMITGDATVNGEAPIICCTAEILATEALREGDYANVQDVIMDEFHYYSDPERGVAWQIPLLTLNRTRFLLMSATMGDSEKFEKILTELNGKDSVIVKSSDRPVPLDFQYSENPLHETVAELIKNGRAPIYLVSFTQRECAEEAQNFMSVDLCTKEEKQTINETLRGFKFSSPFGKDMQKFLKHGIGIHHGGLLPKYRILVEQLAQKGLLKMIMGTDTLGVGVNVPIRTVLFTKLCKFNGSKTTILSVRDFHQISGRAGRKGFDNTGTVVVQAPEHIIENKRAELKAAGDPKKLRKLVKQKPPEKGFLAWNKDTFLKLINSESESLVSRFQVSNAMLLNVLSRSSEDGCRAMKKLIRSSHETGESKKAHRDRAFQMFRALVKRNIIEFKPLRVNVDLQEDFSLNHALSLYLIDTIRLLDPQTENFALDVLTLTESILENPDLILRKQLDRLKSEKVYELKMQGVEYEERMEALEKLEYPKPNREFIYDTFNEFARHHPWVEGENIRPKSVAREIFEGFYSFSEYIKEYDLERAEGTLLRYISDVYKVLEQNIPENFKTEKIYELSVYFESLIRQIDSSLLDEWEKLKTPPGPDGRSEKLEPHHSSEEASNTHFRWDLKAFRILLRNEIFRIVKYLAKKQYDKVAEVLLLSDLEVSQLKSYMQSSFYDLGYGEIIADSESRGPAYFKIEEHPVWCVTQVLKDTSELNDFILEFEVDIEKSKVSALPVIKMKFKRNTMQSDPG